MDTTEAIAPPIKREEIRVYKCFSFFTLWVIAKKVSAAKRKGTKLKRESNLATEKTTERTTTPTNNKTGKSKGVLVILTFSERKVFAAYKTIKERTENTRSACFGMTNKSVVRLVKRTGNNINSMHKIITEAFSRYVIICSLLCSSILNQFIS